MTAIECKLFPAKLAFPPAVKDVGRLRGDEVAVRLTTDAAGFERLAGLTAMRRLWCFGIDDRRLDVLAQCESLEALYLEGVKARNLARLSGLSRLQVLGVEGATKVESLDWLGRINPLSQLRLEHFPRVKVLDAISAQTGIRVLDVSGSMWTKMTVESFGPLADLAGLGVLYLTNIACRDGALHPLVSLSELRELHIAGFHDWHEFARLAGLRPDIDCCWFRPFVEVKHQACKDCRSTLIMLTGKRQPTLCPKCHHDRVRRHVDRFTRLKRQVAEQAHK